MKRPAMILATALAVGLVAGATAGVAAQDDEPGAESVTFATGSLGWPPAEIVPPEVVPVPGGNDESGLMLIDIPVEFSDPRLSGLLTVWGNGTTRDFDDGRAWIESRSNRIVNDGGAWAGPGVLVRAFSDELGVGVGQESMLLTGEGGYAGLIAYLFLDAPPEGEAMWQALILPADAPPMPDPVATE